MISYAQNAEDAVLARLFDRQSDGLYVDIGAGHPVFDSITKHLYDRGWHGVNVEPTRAMYDLLCAQRPRDINVQAAVTDREGTATLHEAPEGNLGASTLEGAVAAGYAASGVPFTTTSVEAITLGSLLASHQISHIDLLKIDVEGHEGTIIRGVDWSVVHPRVLVVEATAPQTRAPTHQGWEDRLTGAGYVCTLFDGLNRFYADASDTEAVDCLSAPANVFDDVEPWKWVSQIEGAKEHIARVEEARREAEARAAKLIRGSPRAYLRRRRSR